jgi:hypothetical protein
MSINGNSPPRSHRTTKGRDQATAWVRQPLPVHFIPEPVVNRHVAELRGPEEWEILIRLTGLCTGMPAEDVDVAAIDDGFFDYMAFTQGLNGAAIRAHYEHGGPERVLDLTLRTGPFGDRYGERPDGLTLEKLKAHPNGINYGPMVPRLPEVLGTADQRVRLAPQYMLDDLPRLAARFERAADDLVLVSRRHLRSNN